MPEVRVADEEAGLMVAVPTAVERGSKIPPDSIMFEPASVRVEKMPTARLPVVAFNGAKTAPPTCVLVPGAKAEENVERAMIWELVSAKDARVAQDPLQSAHPPRIPELVGLVEV